MVALSSCVTDSEYSYSYPLVAGFEYTAIDYAKVFGTDSLYYDSDHGYGIGWEYLAFRHKVDTVNAVFEGGMLLSYLKGKAFDMTDSLSMAKGDSLAFAEDGFRVNENSAYDNTYAVYYGNPEASMMPEHDVQFLATNNGTCTMNACLVNNTGYVAYKVAQCFEAGDRLTLKATGYLDGAKTGEASISLADFSAQKDSIVTSWTYFDLSPLGTVEYVDFEVISTKEDVPAYFCLDGMFANIALSN